MSTIWAFNNLGNKQTLSRGEDCMKKFFSLLKGHVTNIPYVEMKKMLPLTKEELKLN